MATIRDSKASLAHSLRDVLRDLLPQTEGYAIEVDILENDRKKRSDAPRESWRPKTAASAGLHPGPMYSSDAP